MPDPAAFTPAQERALACVLDAIVPPSADGRMPGAGAIGLAPEVVAAFATQPWLEPMVVQGLASLDALARERHGAAFADLPPAERGALVREVDARDGVASGLVTTAYALYYQHPRVVAALGREARPPFPLGYEQPPFDEALIDPVRRRPPRWRDV